MAYQINHIHLKAQDPDKTAQWYVDNFGATLASRGRGLGGSDTIRLDISGIRVNVTSAPAGETLPRGTSQSHYGLEHFGFNTDDVASDVARLQAAGAKILLPVTQTESGSQIAYIEGPDNVRIELVQPLS
jgi:lactoylglutathione lyase